MGLVSRDQGARRKSMLEHRRRRATQRSATTPVGPKGCGAMHSFSSLSLLGDGGHRRRRVALKPNAWRRNGRRWGAGPSLLVANTTSHCSFPPSRRNPVRYAGQRVRNWQVAPVSSRLQSAPHFDVDADRAPHWRGRRQRQRTAAAAAVRFGDGGTPCPVN